RLRPQRGLQAERPRPRTRPGRYPGLPGSQTPRHRRPPLNAHRPEGVMMSTDLALDWLISVDDHILEPPNLWVDRVPRADRDRAPHMEFDDNGVDCWVYDGK